MKNITKFLSLIFFVIISASCSAQEKKEPLPSATFQKEISKENIQLLDVRTPDEYKTGYIQNAVLADWNNNEQFVDIVSRLDKSKPVYVYCRSGGRSGEASEWLSKNGFKEVYDLKGGIVSWKKNGMPVVVN